MNSPSSSGVLSLRDSGTKRIAATHAAQAAAERMEYICLQLSFMAMSGLVNNIISATLYLGKKDSARERIVSPDHAKNDEKYALARGKCGKDLAPLVDEHDVLEDERDQGLDGADAKRLDAARGEVVAQGRAGGGHEAAGPGRDAADEQHRAAADGLGQGHQEEAGDAVDDDGQRRQQVDAPQGYLDLQGREQVEHVDMGRVGK